MLFIIILVDWFTLIFLRKGHQRSCVFVCFFLYSNLIPFCCGLCHWVDCWVFIVYRLFSLCCDYFASSRLKSVDSSNVFHFFKFFSLFCLIFSIMRMIWYQYDTQGTILYLHFSLYKRYVLLFLFSPLFCVSVHTNEGSNIKWTQYVMYWLLYFFVFDHSLDYFTLSSKFVIITEQCEYLP